MLKKEDLVVGQHYICEARDFDIGMWDGVGFQYNRYKCGAIVTVREYYYGDDNSGTVKPLRLVQKG